MVFQKGQSGNPEGRKKGSKNRYTRIKEMICDIVENRQGEIKDMDLKDLLKFVSSTAPKENVVEVKEPISVRWLKPGEEPEAD